MGVPQSMVFSVKETSPGRWDTRCHLCPTGWIGSNTYTGAHGCIEGHYIKHHERDVLAGVWSMDDLALFRDRYGLGV